MKERMKAGFNFSDAVGRGLKFSWDNRGQIAPHAFWPLSLKVSLFIIIALTGMDDNVLRQGLLLIPSYILEGLLVAYVVRFAMLGEAQPLPLARGENDNIHMIAQKRAIFASMLLYVLIKLVVAFAAGTMLSMGTSMPPAAEAPPAPPGSMLVAIALAVITIWSFRLFWIYIPVALDYPVDVFLKKIEGFRISFNMLALWVLCLLPASVVVLFAAQILSVVFPGPAEGVHSVPFSLFLGVLQAVIETVVVVVANVSMAFGFREALSIHKK